MNPPPPSAAEQVALRILVVEDVSIQRRMLARVLSNMGHVVATASNGALTLLMADLDRFKRVNDEHGHRIGDLVLKCFCERTLATLRGSDWMARYGR